MSDPVTLRCGLPLLQPAQAQKHVTVNESLMRLDGLLNLVLNSTTTAAPPAIVVDGQCWGVPFGATESWAGKAGQIAIGANGGWVFVNPQRGQRAFVLDRGAQAVWTGTGWSEGALTLGAFGAGLRAGITEGEVAVTAGTGFWTGIFIPANTMVIGVTARVTQAITGTMTSWTLGMSGSANRFGSGLGLEKNSWGQGLLSAPMSFYTAQNLRVNATGGAFEAGRIRLCIHWLELSLPDSV